MNELPFGLWIIPIIFVGLILMAIVGKRKF
jgi:hypothetical protein